MKRNTTGLAAMAMAVLCNGCGGGGGDAAVPAGFISGSSTTTLVTGTAEGLYEGTASNGRYFNTLVLENNQYYIIYGSRLDNVFTVTGLITGTGQSDSIGFSSPDLKDFPSSGLALNGTMSASFTSGLSFNGVVATGGFARTFAGTALANGRYVYNTQARLADIVGAWSMTALTGAPVLMSVATNGAFTANADGCALNGTLTPRASGKNVFDLVLNFGPAPCALANQSASGHAIAYLREDGRRQLIAAATDTSRSNALVLSGAR